MEGISKRLGDLDARAGSTDHSIPESFADVIKKTISEVKISEEPDMRVRGHGWTKVIRKEEVLVLKLRCPEGASATPSSVSVDGLTNILKSIPVNPLDPDRNYTNIPQNPEGVF